MSSSNHYDQNLLGAAPVATKQQLQEGYNADLLYEEHGRKSATATPPALTAPSTDVETAANGREKPAYNSPAKKLPFIRTTRGKLIILVAGILLLGAIVGGAVGGTVKKNTKTSTVFPTSTGSTLTSDAPSATNFATDEPTTTGKSKSSSSSSSSLGSGGPGILPPGGSPSSTTAAMQGIGS